MSDTETTSQSSELLTVAQAFALTGIRPSVLYKYILEKRVIYVTTRLGKLISRAECERLVQEREGRVRDKAAAIASGQRLCNGPCGQVKPFSEFYRVSKGFAGRSSICGACTQEQIMSGGITRRDYHRRWRQEHKTRQDEEDDKIFDLDEEWIKTKTHYQTYRNIIDAVEAGKRGEKTRDYGFSVVRHCDGSFSYMRLDKILRNGEKPMVQYHFRISETNRRLGDWEAVRLDYSDDWMDAIYKFCFAREKRLHEFRETEQALRNFIKKQQGKAA